MSVQKNSFGDYEIYTLKNKNGVQVGIITLGAAVQSILVPDRCGKLCDVVVGYDTAVEYLSDTEYVGALAGRYANRIGGARFSIDGKEYNITVNEGANTLHGGEGLHHKRFEAVATGESSVSLSLTDPDGADGFPGKLEILVRYKLTDDNELVIDYRAQSDKDTVLNLTNHSYFNLAGSGTVLDHELTVNADSYLEVDAGLIPTGKILSVEGTEMDFRHRRRIANGFYDHCFVLNGNNCAELYEPDSGRKMTVTTDMPGVQVYAGGSMRERTGKSGVKSFKNSAVCLETQRFPDAPNKPEFPSALLRAGEMFESTTVYKFTVDTDIR